MKTAVKTKFRGLDELNVTPLLDLAFTLLVIFFITAAPTVNDLEISLPTASNRSKEPPSKVNYITVDRNGKIYLNAHEVSEEELLRTLVEFRKCSPDLNVVVRADAQIQYQRVVDILDLLVSAKISKVALATEVAKGK